MMGVPVVYSKCILFTRQNSGGFLHLRPIPSLDSRSITGGARSSENSSQILLPRLPFVLLLFGLIRIPRKIQIENPPSDDSAQYNYYCCRGFYYTLYKDIPNGARHPELFPWDSRPLRRGDACLRAGHGGTPSK